MTEETPNPDDTPITFNVKSSADAKYVITLPLTQTVLDLKQKLSGSEHADIPPERQRLIYSGRVLKDAETLASYKVKEGNTVHMVKSAASNQNQNPASTGTSTASGGSQPATGVPTNLASGTGRDPLAALTGARYAGYAQMPNANMFGPDGGMGPPPDPEHMASMLENPQFSSQLSEALSNPEVVEQMIRSNPMFQGPMGQQARQMLQDPNFRRMMTDPETLRSMSAMRRSGMLGDMGGMGGGGGSQPFAMPGNAEGQESGGEANRTGGAQQGQGNASQPQLPNPFAMPGAGAGAAGNPFAALFPGGMGGMGGNAAAGSTPGGQTQGAGTGTGQNPQQPNQGQPANPFQGVMQMLQNNPGLMEQMTQAMMGGGGGGGAAGNTNPSDPNAPRQPQNPLAALQAMGGLGGFNPGGGGFGGFGGGPSPQPQDDRSPEDRYAEQLTQLNEMGFHEFERNVEALRRTGGSVQGAVEYLLSH